MFKTIACVKMRSLYMKAWTVVKGPELFFLNIFRLLDCHRLLIADSIVLKYIPYFKHSTGIKL